MFYTYPSHAHLASLENGPGAVPSGRVPVETGDALLTRLGVCDVDLIKIDVEGHELETLRGLRDTIANRRPVVAMEWTLQSRDKFATLNALKDHFPVYTILGTTMSLSSRLFKTALALEPFNFHKTYVHALCVPDERVADLRAAV
jgi:hypothetical protein